MKKRKKKALLTVLIVLAALAALAAAFSAAVNAIMIYREGKLIDTDAADEKYDCVLILGAHVYENGRPCGMLADRLDRGIELYFAGAADKILVSGDHGSDDYDEVNAMKAYCVNAGVPSEDVFMDHAGFSTYDSVVRAKKIFGCESVMIVTQKYHLYRALYIARSNGLRCAGASASAHEYGGQRMREAREFLARVKDFGYVVFGVKPVFLGDPVPISGSGDATNDL